MNTYEKLVLAYVDGPCSSCKKYSPRGKTFSVDNKYYQGNYWFYESKDFIIDIHDLYIGEDVIEENIPDMTNILFLSSKYLISGSGEWFEPYQTFEPNSMFIMDPLAPAQRYLLHGGSRYFMVGMMFKKSMVEKYFVEKQDIKIKDLSAIFTETKEDVTHPISRLAEEIVACQMDGLSAELFFDAKAKEWLSITLDAYENRKTKKKLSLSDEKALENVASYINDHYNFTISQNLLEKIAAMSGTKLKTSFKNKYHMTITEYTQRKRMNIAENLLLTTDLEVRAIAKSVGYNSASRFSSLYKRYKGIFPMEARKKWQDSEADPCPCSENSPVDFQPPPNSLS